MLKFVVSLFWWLSAFLRLRNSLGLEIVALRQQVSVLKRKNHRPRLSLVGSGTGAVGRRCPRAPVSSSRHITRSVQISRTTRSCTLHDKGYEAYRDEAAAQEGG